MRLDPHFGQSGQGFLDLQALLGRLPRFDSVLSGRAGLVHHQHLQFAALIGPHALPLLGQVGARDAPDQVQGQAVAAAQLCGHESSDAASAAGADPGALQLSPRGSLQRPAHRAHDPSLPVAQSHLGLIGR